MEVMLINKDSIHDISDTSLFWTHSFNRDPIPCNITPKINVDTSIIILGGTKFVLKHP